MGSRFDQFLTPGAQPDAAAPAAPDDAANRFTPFATGEALRQPAGPSDPRTGFSYSPDDAAAFARIPQGASAIDALRQVGVGGPKPFGVLPIRQDENGSLHFDPSQGVLGAMWRGFNAPADAYNGKFDPMSPEGQARARETAMLINPTNPAIMAGERTVPGVLQSTRTVAPKVPTAEELKTAASAGYDGARATGAEYPGQDVGAMANDLTRSLQEDGILAELAPQTHTILGKLANPPAGSVATIASIDAARRALGRVRAGNFGNATEQEAARRAIDGIDQLVRSSADGAAVGAPGAGSNLPVPLAAAGAGGADGAGAGGMAAQAEAARLLEAARGNRAAAFRSDQLNGIEDAADMRAASSNSGQNGGNALRQRITSLLLSDKQSLGFSPAELAAMRQVVDGTATSNTLRYVSNLLGAGGGLGQSTITALGAGIGAMKGGEVGATIGAALPAAAGSATRSGYNGLVSRQLGKIDEATRMRSPLFQQRQADAGLRAQGTDIFAAQLLKALGLTEDGSQR